MDREFLEFVIRYLHVFAGLIWIGFLYYINFAQGAFLNEIDAPNKTVVQMKLFPRVMWWFRYAALWTFLIGLYLLAIYGKEMKFTATSYWVNILTGSLFGTLMAANVWFLIWPRQKLIIANATGVSKGDAPIAGIADQAVRATVASRTNVMFSISMLFFMLAGRHWSYEVRADMVVVYAILLLIIAGALEFNAIWGKLGPLTTVRGVLTAGFCLLAAIVLTIVMVVKA